jgi:integral membrane protein
VNDPVTRFRVTANLVGIGLLILVFVAMPLKYLAGNETVIGIHGPIHGLLYMLYVGATIDLGMRARWPLRRTVGVLLAGTVPFLSFVVERRVVRRLLAEEEAEAAAESAA